MKQPLKPETIVHRLRLMAESGGSITRDRRDVIIEAADTIELQLAQINVLAENCRQFAHEVNGLRKEVSVHEEH